MKQDSSLPETSTFHVIAHLPDLLITGTVLPIPRSLTEEGRTWRLPSAGGIQNVTMKVLLVVEIFLRIISCGLVVIAGYHRSAALLILWMNKQFIPYKALIIILLFILSEL